MPVTFVQQKKRQRLLIAALGAVALVTAFVLWQGFGTTGGPSSGPVVAPERTVELDFGVLESEALRTFAVPPPAVVPVSESGRANPFLP